MRIKDEYRLTSYSEFHEHLHNPDMSKIRDFTDNGKCRDCGNCCGNFLPITPDDYKRIKDYIKVHSIEPARPRILLGPWSRPTAHNLCPFLLDAEEHRCAIYPVRPGICKVWSCHKPAENSEIKKWYFSAPYVKTLDMYMTFYPEQTIKELEHIIKEVK